MQKLNQLAADTTNGVYVCENSKNTPYMEDAPKEVLDGEFFYNCLPDLKDDEIIYGLVSDEIVDKIKSEYGIK